MSVLNQIACFQNRRDEVPNQTLARQLAGGQDRAGIREIAANLTNPDPNVQSDCLKVLYETGYLAPDLIAGYVADFLALLDHKNNRMVWGAMIALSTIAALKPAEIAAAIPQIKHLLETGSVITVDNAVKILSTLASQGGAQGDELFAYLIDFLAVCRPQDAPRHAEVLLVAVTAANKDALITALEKRLPEMTPAQVTRTRRILKEAAKRVSSQ